MEMSRQRRGAFEKEQGGKKAAVFPLGGMTEQSKTEGELGERAANINQGKSVYMTIWRFQQAGK